MLAFTLGLLLVSGLIGSRVPEWLNRGLDSSEGTQELAPIREVVTVRQRRLPARRVAIGPAPTADAPDIRLPLLDGSTDAVGRCMEILVRPGFFSVPWFETEGVLTDCPADTDQGMSSELSP